MSKQISNEQEFEDNLKKLDELYEEGKTEEHNYTPKQIIEWLRELADEAEAQVIVVHMRDNPIT